MEQMITGAQIRAARAFLRWSATELAEKAKLGISTVQAIEASDGVPTAGGGLEWRATARDQSIKAIAETLAKAGVTFLDDDGNGLGVRVKGKTARLATDRLAKTSK